MYEIIFLKDLYDDSQIRINAGYINQAKNSHKKTIPQPGIVSIANGQHILLFLEAKTPTMLFTLRSYARYQHIMHNLFCLTASPVGPLYTQDNHKLSETTLNKIHQWLKHEQRLLGI